MEIIEKFSRFYTDISSMQIDELSNIYEKNVVFIDPIATHKGIESVENYFSRLLKSAKLCEFTIHKKVPAGDDSYVVNWTMSYTSNRLNKGKPVDVDGITILEIINNKIVFHRDYYDLGQMVYEHIPILGTFIKKIKRKLS